MAISLQKGVADSWSLVFSLLVVHFVFFSSSRSTIIACNTTHSVSIAHSIWAGVGSCRAGVAYRQLLFVDLNELVENLIAYVVLQLARIVRHEPDAVSAPFCNVLLQLLA